jgi:hypothetical protein
MKTPDAFGTCHDVEIVGLIPVRDHNRVITSGNENYITVFDCHGFIEVARIGVDTLENETLRGIDSVIVGFFQ